MPFFEFDQNNSGGRFDINANKGIGPRIWIEGEDRDDAIKRAEAIGIYFDGVSEGCDCECCGDRWYRPSDHATREAPEINFVWDYSYHDTVYIHKLGGTIEQIKKPENALTLREYLDARSDQR